MGWRWEVELYCVMTSPDGREGWGWEHIYGGDSFRQAIKIARSKKKETNGVVRMTWR
jgi:hypothetical protein